MSGRVSKLESLGYPIDRIPKPGAIYVPVVMDGRTGYVSGAVPFDGPGNVVCTGKVPSQTTVAAAQKAAALCAANLLRFAHQAVGDLEKIERIVRLTGYVNCDPDFTDQHLVINGASQLMADVMGEQGWHARTAIGVASLPLGSSVEVEMIFRV
ncbi:MAG: RidA family protein [Nannocystaceae bacterium]